MEFKDLIARRHPAYEAHERDWSRWLMAYRAQRAYLGEVLHRHKREKTPDYNKRLERAYLRNYLRRVVENFTNYLFRVEWEIIAPPGMQDFVDQADRAGNDFLSFFRRYAPLAGVLGQFYVGIDEPPNTLGRPFQNVAEQERFGVRPYLYFISPLDLLDWTIDETGAITEAITREPLPRTLGGTAKTAYTYRVWTAKQVFLVDGDGAQIGEPIEHHFGVVPIVPVRFKSDGDPVIGLSLSAAIEPLQAEIINVTSLQQEIHYLQSFSFLAIPGDGLGYIKRDKDGNVVGLNQSIYEAFFYDPQAGPPQYISPDPAQSQALREYAAELRDELYEIGNVQRNTDGPSGVESAEAKAFRHLGTNYDLQDIAGNFQRAMDRVLQLVATRRKVAYSDLTLAVIRPNDFGLSNVARDSAIAMQLNQIDRSDSLLLAYLQRMAAADFPGDEKLLAAIEEEFQVRTAYKEASEARQEQAILGVEEGE